MRPNATRRAADPIITLKDLNQKPAKQTIFLMVSLFSPEIITTENHLQAFFFRVNFSARIHCRPERIMLKLSKLTLLRILRTKTFQKALI